MIIEAGLNDVKTEYLLAESEIEANIIYSVDSKKNIGLLDILPKTAAKEPALVFLWKNLTDFLRIYQNCHFLKIMALVE